MLSQVTESTSTPSKKDERGSGRIVIVEAPANSRRPSVAVLTLASGRNYRVSID